MKHDVRGEKKKSQTSTSVTPAVATVEIFSARILPRNPLKVLNVESINLKYILLSKKGMIKRRAADSRLRGYFRRRKKNKSARVPKQQMRK